MTLETLSEEDARRLAGSELSLKAKLRHVALLLAALTMTGVTAVLAVTEPVLPARTRIALTVMSLIGLSWAGYATWVLARRNVALARHDLIASRMAVAYSALFTLVAMFGALADGPRRSIALAAAGTGAVMLTVAIVLLLRARRRVVTLVARRAALEARLSQVDMPVGRVPDSPANDISSAGR